MVKKKDDVASDVAPVEADVVELVIPEDYKVSPLDPVACPNCSGSGVSAEVDVCSNCSGSGKV